MDANGLGAAVDEAWQWLSSQYPYVVLDEWCLMPNHLHGILVLTGGRGGSRTAPTPESTSESATETTIKPVGRLIGAFKTVSTKRINQLRDTPGDVVWQRNYWEHIIRTDDELDRVRAYISNNSVNWTADSLNTARRVSERAK
jgi:REP element-mobilizing transposase RayT